jgi:hypothetical protein
LANEDVPPVTDHDKDKGDDDDALHSDPAVDPSQESYTGTDDEPELSADHQPILIQNRYFRHCLCHSQQNTPRRNINQMLIGSFKISERRLMKTWLKRYVAYVDNRALFVRCVLPLFAIYVGWHLQFPMVATMLSLSQSILAVVGYSIRGYHHHSADNDCLVLIQLIQFTAESTRVTKLLVAYGVTAKQFQKLVGRVAKDVGHLKNALQVHDSASEKLSIASDITTISKARPAYASRYKHPSRQTAPARADGLKQTPKVVDAPQLDGMPPPSSRFSGADVDAYMLQFDT